MAMEFNDRRHSAPFKHPGFSIDNTAEYKKRRAEYDAANPPKSFPSAKGLSDKYGTKLPRASKPRTDAEWKARASVISAARAGSIKKMPKKGK